MSVDRMPLRPAHADLVRGLIATNPGISLYRLAGLVATRCGTPTVGYATLRRFMQLHGIAMPKRIPRPPKPQRVTGFSPRAPQPAPELTAVGLPGQTEVDASHAALAARSASVFAQGGLCPAPAPKALPAGIQRDPDLLRKGQERLRALLHREHERLRAEAVSEATQWITRRQLQAAAAASLAAAIHHMHRDIDDEDYDPMNPRAWFRGFEFAEDVVDLFRLAVYRLAADAGIDGAADEVRRLAALGGAERLQELMP